MKVHSRTIRLATTALAMVVLVPAIFTLRGGSVGGIKSAPYSVDGGGVVLDWIRVTSGLPAGEEYYGIDFGDVNNDGNMDVAGLAPGSGMHVFVGDGAGNFVEESTGITSASGLQTNVFLADFNNDGNLDIAGDGVYFGNGGAGGSMLWTLTNDPGSWFAGTSADFNLDGKMDIVAGTGSGVRAWRGNGGAGGTMVWTGSSTGLPGSGTYFECKVADMDHDGKPDIVCADNANGIRVWRGNGGTSWTNAYTGSGLPTADAIMGIGLGDVNHDGNLDIVATGYYDPVGVRVWLGDGGAGGALNFIENSNGLDTGSRYWIGVTLQDTNNDGNLDILAANYGGGLSLWLGDGGTGGTMDWTDTSAGLPSGSYVGVDGGDFNNDGKNDFVAAGSSGVEVWQNERPDFSITGYVPASVNLPASNTWADVQFADVDHNGITDIGFTSFQNQNRGMRVFLGDGTGVWTNSSTGLPMTGSFDALRFADINHDGTLDIISGQDVGNPGNAGIHVWSGDGAGSWTEMSTVSANSCAGLELVDVNNDGDLDIVTGHYANGWGPMIFLGNGDFTWGPDVGPSGSTLNADDVAVADVNHDGKLDFAASSMNNVGIQLWTGDGSGTAAGWQRNDSGLPTTGVYLGLAFADANHDGNPDLVGSAYAGGAAGVSVWLGNGGAGGAMVWTPSNTGLPVTAQYAGVEFGDTNLDGDTDMVFADARNSGAAGIGYRRGDGGSGGSVVWSSPAITGIPTSGQYWGVAFGDMDNDGITDIAVAGANGVRVYKQGRPPPTNPRITITSPSGVQDWTGGTPHLITWTMTDDATPAGQLKVYLNYSSTPSSGVIAGPLIGATSQSWNVPVIDAGDVLVNATVIDGDGEKGYNEVFVPRVDSTAPTVVSASPTGSSIGLTVPAVIVFSETMARITTESSFSIAPNPGSLTFSWSQTTVPDDTLTVNHAPFASGTPHTATVSTGARDVSDTGNPLATQYQWSFTTITSNPPTITIAIPVGAESWTGVTQHDISFTASDAEDSTANLRVWVNYSITGGPPYNFPIAALQGVPGTSSPYTWTLPPEDSATIVLNATVIDTAGLRGFDNSPAFEIDSTRPTVVSTQPASGASGVPTSAVVLTRWSEQMDATSAESSFSLKDTITWTPVAGVFSWGGAFMTFTPSAMLAPSTQFSANLTATAKDDSQPGNTLATPYVWTFTTAAVPDTTPPTVTAVTATPDPQEVFLSVNISAQIQDDVAVGQSWCNVSAPLGGSTNLTMSFDSGSGRYYLSRIYVVVGVHDFRVWAADTSGNWNSASGQFTVEDNTPPVITNLMASPDPVLVSQQTTLSATVTDNFQLSSVYANVTAPDLTWSNQSMAGGPTFSLAFAAAMSGLYTFRVVAVDSIGNWNTASGTFSAIQLQFLPPDIQHTASATWWVGDSLNITATVTDDTSVQVVRLNYTDVDGAVSNVSMSPGVSDVYFFVVPAQTHSGSIGYHFWAVDNIGNSTRSQAYTTSIVLRRPSPPTLTVSVIGPGALRLQWTRPTTNEGGSPLTDLTGFNIYRMTQSGGTKTPLGTVQGTMFNDTGLGDGKTFWYVLTAVNSQGTESNYSIEAWGTTPSPTVSSDNTVILIAIVIIVTIVVVLLLLLLLRRRKKKGGELHLEPGQKPQKEATFEQVERQ